MNNDDRRQRRAVGMLWAWAESDPSHAAHEHGHPSTSPTHRMMHGCVPGSGNSRVTGRWRQRVRRSNSHHIELTPAATCYGTETKSRRMPERTGPEADADRMGTPYAVARVIADMPADMQAIIYARFVERRERMQDIAEYIDRPGLERKSCSALYRNAVELVAMRLIDTPEADRKKAAGQAATAL